MTFSVPYLSIDAIEQESNRLLAGFAEKSGIRLQAPVPIEDIVEKHLGLALDFDDLHTLLEVPRLNSEPDILGALYVEGRRVVIDESLDPELNPDKEGRYGFSLGHEAAHWWLHRASIQANSGQSDLFDDAVPPGASVVCRSTDAKKRIELQADKFSAFTLMPRQLLLGFWEENFGNLNPVDWTVNLVPLARRPGSSIHMPSIQKREYLSDESEDFVFNLIAGELARVFKVSRQAMRIRLNQLGLLKSKTDLQSSFAVAG